MINNLLKEKVVFEESINGFNCRVIIGWTKYGKIDIDTYIPQMEHNGEWVNVISGVIYKDTQVGKDPNSVSVDQLDQAVSFLKIKSKQILSVRKQIEELYDLKVFISNS